MKETLPYFDAAIAASYINVPTLCSLARFDPAVAPPGQFSVYNAIPESCRSLFVRTVGHFEEYDQPGELKAEVEELQRFLTEL